MPRSPPSTVPRPPPSGKYPVLVSRRGHGYFVLSASSPGARGDPSPDARVTVRLVLYVAGDTPRSRSARSTLQWLQDGVPEPMEVEVVDVVESPERADGARVLLTPTLVREEPLPQRRVVGDLGATARVAEALGLTCAPPPPTEQQP